MGGNPKKGPLFPAGTLKGGLPPKNRPPLGETGWWPQIKSQGAGGFFRFKKGKGAGKSQKGRGPGRGL